MHICVNVTIIRHYIILRFILNSGEKNVTGDTSSMFDLEIRAVRRRADVAIAASTRHRLPVRADTSRQALKKLLQP